MTEPSTEPAGAAGLPAHRIEALTDGIYAVAMTLLVIDLKLPDHAALRDNAALLPALAELLPKFGAWVISFFVLAVFWFGHHRAFSHVRRVDGRLVALGIGQLAFVSLMPFSCALVGEHGRAFVSQLVYSSNMAALGVMALLISRHIHRHPEGTLMAMPAAAYRGAQVRMFGLIALSALAVAINVALPSGGNIAFMLMAVIMPLSRRVERAGAARDARPA